MWKVNSVTFTSLLQNVSQTGTIQLNKKTRIEKMALCGASTGSLADDLYIQVKIDDSNLFNNFIPTRAFQDGAGYVYALPEPLEIEAKKTISVEAKTSGSTVSTFVVVFHGKEI